MALLASPPAAHRAAAARATSWSAASRRPARVTEAYTWPVTALIAGFAVGTAIGGALVEASSWHACFLAAARARGGRRAARRARRRGTLVAA